MAKATPSFSCEWFRSLLKAFGGFLPEWGGTLKIIQSCKEAGLAEPEITEKNGGVQVTIFKDIIDGNQGGNQDSGEVSSLTTRQKEVFELILANPKISISHIADKMGINRSAAQEHIDVLKAKGVIERKGGTRGMWTIRNSLG